MLYLAAFYRQLHVVNAQTSMHVAKGEITCLQAALIEYQQNITDKKQNVCNNADLLSIFVSLYMQ